MKLAYIYDKEIGNFHFGPKHPMKPHRVTLTHSLIHSYKLDRYFDVISPKIDDISEFHPPNFLQNYVCMDNDCPKFVGIEEFGKRTVSGSVNAAKLLIAREYDTVINWGGGMHHAGKNKPAGFCYSNDIVISIIELLKYYEKVLYLDIDVHHGDAVEEAFYSTNRVFTLSFHKYGDNYFPRTGSLCNTGIDEGIGFACNIPLKTGIFDSNYEYVFKPVVDSVIGKYRPDVIVMQCGADSIVGDKIGCFNLSIRQHSRCIKYVSDFGIPMLVLGGGGYVPRNVSRCWANATSVLCGVEIDNEIPENDPFYLHYGPEFKIHDDSFVGKFKENNTKEYLDIVKGFVFDVLNKI